VIFHAHVADLKFDIAGKRYIVPKESNVEIPDAYAVLVKRRGLLLKEGPAEAAPTAAPIKPVAARRRRPPMTKKQAAEVRANAREMRAELASLTGEISDDDDNEE
jgi:hypothetical protein